MSHTIAVDVVGPSHWSYMALVMARILEEAAKRFSLGKTDVPPGVLVDAVRFSGLVLSGSPNSPTPSNPPASLNAFLIALQATERVVRHHPWQADRRLMLFGCRMVVDLSLDIDSGTNNVFESKGLQILPAVNFMSKFFSELSKMGEEERSSQLASGDNLDE